MQEKYFAVRSIEMEYMLLLAAVVTILAFGLFTRNVLINKRQKKAFFSPLLQDEPKLESYPDNPFVSKMRKLSDSQLLDALSKREEFEEQAAKAIDIVVDERALQISRQKSDL